MKKQIKIIKILFVMLLITSCVGKNSKDEITICAKNGHDYVIVLSNNSFEGRTHIYHDVKCERCKIKNRHTR